MRFRQPAFEAHPHQNEAKCRFRGFSALLCMIVVGGMTALCGSAQDMEERWMSAVLEISPSRFIGPDQMDDYIKRISSRFAINTRELDVFGLSPNPKHKNIILRDPPFQNPKIKFADVIPRIRVATLMPSESSFMVGDRLLKKGDRVPIKFRNIQYDVEIVAVTAKQIDFANVQTGEVVPLMMDRLPAHMAPN